MPHRATYFFPRQFPERGLDESLKQLLDHEKKKIVNSLKSEIFDVDPKKAVTTTAAGTTTNDDIFFPSAKHSAVSDLFTGNDKFRTKQKKVAPFPDWFLERKGYRSSHVKLQSSRFSCEEDRELLLPPESEPPLPETVEDSIDRSFDRQVSLPRLSSGSSYAGSLFSGTTLDCNFSRDIKVETTSSRVSPTTRRMEEESETLAQKCKESFCLQITLAKRLTYLASLAADEPVLALDAGFETWDVESFLIVSGLAAAYHTPTKYQMAFITS